MLSNNARKLLALVNIIGHHGKRYRLVFGADETKVTITGSKDDMQYYQDVNFWSLYGKKLAVAEANEHLGLTVSCPDEEIKNFDKNICSKGLYLWIPWKYLLLQVYLSSSAALAIRPPVHLPQ